MPLTSSIFGGDFRRGLRQPQEIVCVVDQTGAEYSAYVGEAYGYHRYWRDTCKEVFVFNAENEIKPSVDIEANHDLQCDNCDVLENWIIYEAYGWPFRSACCLIVEKKDDREYAYSHVGATSWKRLGSDLSSSYVDCSSLPYNILWNGFAMNVLCIDMFFGLYMLWGPNCIYCY